MCIILVAEKKIKQEYLENSFFANDDGIGIAWFQDEYAYFKKGFTKLEDFISFYEKLFENKSIIRHVIHFRLASSGEVNKLLTHPFEVDINVKNKLEGKTKKQLIFHNGTESQEIDKYFTFALIHKKKIEYPLNDSLAISKIYSVLGENYLKHLKSKFVVMDPVRKRIKMFGAFVKEEGEFYASNSTYSYRYNRITIKNNDIYNYYLNFDENQNDNNNNNNNVQNIVNKNECKYKDNYDNCVTKNYRKCSFINSDCPYKNY